MTGRRVAHLWAVDYHYPHVQVPRLKYHGSKTQSRIVQINTRHTSTVSPLTLTTLTQILRFPCTSPPVDNTKALALQSLICQQSCLGRCFLRRRVRPTNRRHTIHCRNFRLSPGLQALKQSVRQLISALCRSKRTKNVPDRTHGVACLSLCCKEPVSISATPPARFLIPTIPVITVYSIFPHFWSTSDLLSPRSTNPRTLEGCTVLQSRLSNPRPAVTVLPLDPRAHGYDQGTFRRYYWQRRRSRRKPKTANYC